MQDEYPGMPSTTFYPLLLSFPPFVALSTTLNSLHCPSSILGQVEWVAHSSCHGRFWSWFNTGDRSPSHWAFYKINLSLHITNSIPADKYQWLFKITYLTPIRWERIKSRRKFYSATYVFVSKTKASKRTSVWNGNPEDLVSGIRQLSSLCQFVWGLDVLG